jgi:cytokinin dehydrogenase
LDERSAAAFIHGYKTLLLEICGPAGENLNLLERLVEGRTKLVSDAALLDNALSHIHARAQRVEEGVISAATTLQVKSWVYLRDTRHYSIFMEPAAIFAYGAVGIKDRIKELLGGAGALVETGLVLYEGRIVCDGLIIAGPDNKQERQGVASMELISRRGFLESVAASVAVSANGQLAFSEEMSGAEQMRIRESLAGRLAGDLPSFDGIFVFDQSVCRAMATDYGHHVHHMPVGALFPKSVKDVQKAIRYANSQRMKITMRGTGGSAYGQSQVNAGIVIDSSPLSHMNWVTAESIDAGPGALWKDVVAFTMTRNMAPPVLPDRLYISVGGTLNAGGVGETSYRLGAQVDHVLEMDVVTGAGDFVTCSPSRHSELFYMVLAGMGQCGLIVRARLKLVPAPDQVVARRFAYADRNTFLSDLAMLATAETDGAIAGDLNLGKDGATWTPVITATSFGTRPPGWLTSINGNNAETPVTQGYAEYLNRNTEGYLATLASGVRFLPHAYMNFFLPADQARSMVDYLMNTPGATLGAEEIAVFPMINSHFNQPLQRMPAGSMSYHMRIYRVADREGSPDHLQMLALNQNECLPRIFASGGTVYLPFSPLLDSGQRLQQFNEAIWKRFTAAKSTYDPAGVLTPGAGMFQA